MERVFKELGLDAIEQVPFEDGLKTAKHVRFPLIPGTGRLVNLTNEQIYNLIELP